MLLLVESCHTQVLESCYPGSNEAEMTHGSDALAVSHKQLLALQPKPLPALRYPQAAKC